MIGIEPSIFEDKELFDVSAGVDGGDCSGRGKRNPGLG
jgi:hypothetical protein